MKVVGLSGSIAAAAATMQRQFNSFPDFPEDAFPDLPPVTLLILLERPLSNSPRQEHGFNTPLTTPASVWSPPSQMM